MTLQTRTVAIADLELDDDINARRHRGPGDISQTTPAAVIEDDPDFDEIEDDQDEAA